MAKYYKPKPMDAATAKKIADMLAENKVKLEASKLRGKGDRGTPPLKQVA